MWNIGPSSVDLTGEANEKAQKEFEILRDELGREEGKTIPVGFAHGQAMHDPEAKNCGRIAGVFGKEIGKEIRCVAG